jgi:hypothetical protein
MSLSFKIFLLCVRWYLANNLSLRDLEEMMAERGIHVDHSTVHRWVVHFAPLLLERFNRRKRPVTGKWHFADPTALLSTVAKPTMRPGVLPLPQHFPDCLCRFPDDDVRFGLRQAKRRGKAEDIALRHCSRNQAALQEGC